MNQIIQLKFQDRLRHDNLEEYDLAAEKDVIEAKKDAEK